MNSIFSKSLRDQRRGAVLLGLGLAFMLAVTVIGYVVQFGATPAERAVGLQALLPIMESVKLLAAEPLDITTLGGFVTWRLFNLIPLFTGIFAIVVATRLTRGEEEARISEMVVVAASQSRTRILLQLWLGLVTVLAVVGALMGLGLWLSARPFEGFAWDQIGLAVTNIMWHALMWGSLAMVFAQVLSRRRHAVAVTLILMVVLWFVYNLSVTLPQLHNLGAFTPFTAYAANRPLTADFVFKPFPYLLAPALSVLFVGVAAVLYSRRDLGIGMLPAPRNRVALTHSDAFWLGSLFRKTLRDTLVSALSWGVGMGLFGALVVGLSNTVIETMQNLFPPDSPLGHLFGGSISPNAFLGLALFSFLPVLMAVYAITSVARWLSEESSGRLEMVMSTPHARTELLTQHLLVLGLGMGLSVCVTGMFIFGTAARFGVALDYGYVLRGLAATWPLAGLVLTGGAAMGAWFKRPGAVIPILAALVGGAFLINLLSELLTLPQVLLWTSIFYAYGRPMRDEWSVAGTLFTLGLAAVSGVIAGIGFARRDLQRG